MPPCLGTSVLTVTFIFVFQLNKTFLTWLIIFKYISNTQASFPSICCFEFSHFFFAFNWYFIIKHTFIIFWCPLFFLNHQLTGFIIFKRQVTIAKYLSPFLCGITDLNGAHPINRPKWESNVSREISGFSEWKAWNRSSLSKTLEARSVSCTFANAQFLAISMVAWKIIIKKDKCYLTTASSNADWVWCFQI